MIYSKKDFDIDKLGCFYSKEETTFRVFSTSEKIFIVLDENRYELNKNGLIFEITFEGDHELERYYYLNDANERFIDPFSYVTIDDYSYVVDTDKFNKEIYKPLDYDLPIIYELSVRDFSSLIDHPYSKKFLGLTVEGLKIDDYPIGFDYVKDLGITHIQIMPILDFDNDKREYNWGYNPINYNYVKKDYVYEQDNPYAYINELRSVVNKYHENNIRVNLDVVFNHVYKQRTFSLEKMLKGHIFRYEEDGKYANGSLCGNEIKSEDPFVREYFKKMVRNYIELFDIDGIRMDLMGLLDNITVNEIYNDAKSIKNDFMVYGEGWDMSKVLDNSLKACISNASKMKNIPMFNDFYRDKMIHYVSGNFLINDEIKKAINANSEYLKNNQSINYVECHDNYTFYDRMCIYKNDEYIIDRCKLALALIILSKGIPFIHMGQEFLRSKCQIDNTYNFGDEINGIDYLEAYKHKELVEYFKNLIEIRKKYNDEYYLDVRFREYETFIIYKIGKLNIYINPTNRNLEVKEDKILVFNGHNIVNERVNSIKVKALHLIVALDL